MKYSNFGVTLTMMVLIFTPDLALPDTGSGWYASSELGANFASSIDTDGADLDRASKCDECINPNYAAMAECTTSRQAGDSTWANNFGDATGILVGIALGHRPHERVCFELEYFYQNSEYNETSPLADGGGSVIAKTGGELEQLEERINSLTSYNLFGNLCFDFINSSHFTPSLGLGAGIGFTEMEYRGLFARNLDLMRSPRSMVFQAPWKCARDWLVQPRVSRPSSRYRVWLPTAVWGGLRAHRDVIPRAERSLGEL